MKTTHEYDVTTTECPCECTEIFEFDDEDPDGFFMNTYYYDGDSYDDIPGFRD